jgi:hypothetical protein
MVRCLKKIIRYIVGIIVIAVFLLCYLMYFQPAFYFPKPTGFYAVGLKTLYLVDNNRKENLSYDCAHQQRELVVNVWYPAQGALSLQPVLAYVAHLICYAKMCNKIQRFLFGYTRSIYSYAKKDILLSADKKEYPVIIFSHGFGFTRDSNTAQCEELASHGYIVVGISHTYDCCVVQFPDGRIIDGGASIDQRFVNKNFTETVEYLDKEIEVWVSDVRFVLDRIEFFSADKKSFFYQHIDKKNIGIFGHSFGGATAVQSCRRDYRIKVGAFLDGCLFGSDIIKHFNKPFLFMLSERFCQPWRFVDWQKLGIKSQSEKVLFIDRYFEAINQLAKSIGLSAKIHVLKDSKHLAFCDDVLLKHASILSFFGYGFDTGTVNGFYATKIINETLVSFFNKHLKTSQIIY